jgi:hypothetical protein
MMTVPNRYEIYLRPGPNGSLQCRQGLVGSWHDTRLGPDTVYDGDNSETLSQLLSELATIKDIREIERKLTFTRQASIGLDLHRALFPDGVNLNGVPWLHIVPCLAEIGDASARRLRDDFLDFVLRIPWIFLTSELSDSAKFLVLRQTNPTAITIDAAPGRQDRPRFDSVRMPPCPRVLLICPIADPEINGREHGRELSEILLREYDKENLTRNIRLITKFSEFEGSIETFNPNIIYFYGHASSQGQDTIIQFDEEDRDDIYHGSRSIDEVRQALNRQLPGVPPIIWINACQGASAERNNVLRLLSPVAAAVITTRTLAVVDDSLELGRQILPKIAIHGDAPPVAVRKAIPELKAEAVRSARWATTVVAVQYGSWTALATEKRNLTDIESGGDFPIRMDRAGPLEAIAGQIRQNLQARERKAHFILWHAPPSQAPGIFERRFTDLVVESFPGDAPVIRRVELQPNARARAAAEGPLDPHFLDCIYRSLNDIPAMSPLGHIDLNNIDRSLSALRASGSRILLLIHGPFQSSHRGLVEDYYRFWGDLYPALLAVDPIQICLGLHFVEEADFEPPESKPDMLVKPLDPVPVDELKDHLKTFGRFYNVPEARAEDEARVLIKKTQALFLPIYNILTERISFDWDRG